jgi:hypothetical protein
MTYLLIALLIALAIAPLMHFMPSKRQREQAQLRERAALSGLFVEFRDLPGKPEALARMPAADRQVIYYGLRLSPSRGKERRNGSWIRAGGDWQAVGSRLPAPASLTGMAPEILGASIDEGSCGVYWREQGDTETVERIVAALKAWAEVV